MAFNKLNAHHSSLRLLSENPLWIIRYGASLLAGFLMLVVVLTFFIPYPQTFENKIKIRALEEPFVVKSHKSGRIDEVFIKDEQIVEKGQVLAVLKSEVDYYEIGSLQGLIDSLTGLDFKSENSINTIKKLLEKNEVVQDNLGIIKENYQNFLNSMDRYLSSHAAYQIGKINLLAEKKEITNLREFAIKKSEVYEEKIITQNRKHDIYVKLYSDQIIAESEYLDRNLNLLNGEIESLNSSELILNYDLREIEIKNKELQLKSEFEDRRQMVLNELGRLQATISNWRFDNVIESPASGKIVLPNKFKENRIVDLDEVLFKIISVQNNQLYGELLITPEYLHQIKLGQDVIISIDGYDSNFYGTVPGKVERISAAPLIDDSYIIDVSIGSSLLTNRNFQVHYFIGMVGNAEVLLKKQSLGRYILIQVADEYFEF